MEANGVIDRKPDVYGSEKRSSPMIFPDSSTCHD
jgi:hypothetical protein